MLNRIQTLSGSWEFNGYAKLALAIIGQAAVDLRTRSYLSAVEWLLSRDFILLAECLGLPPGKLRYEILHYQYFEQESGLAMSRTFKLVRQADVSGVSGTGVVAEGVVFKSGKTILCWIRAPHTVTVFNSPDEVLMVHGHAGSTLLLWDDPAQLAGRIPSRTLKKRILREEWWEEV